MKSWQQEGHTAAGKMHNDTATRLALSCFNFHNRALRSGLTEEIKANLDIVLNENQSNICSPKKNKTHIFQIDSIFWTKVLQNILQEYYIKEMQLPKRSKTCYFICFRKERENESPYKDE